MAALVKVDDVFQAVRRASYGLINAAGGEVATQYYDGFAMLSPAYPVLQRDQKTGKHVPTNQVMRHVFRVRFVVEALGGQTSEVPAEAPVENADEAEVAADDGDVDEAEVAADDGDAEGGAGSVWAGEVCKRCGRRNVVGYNVPDALWAVVVGDEDTVWCLTCFDEVAEQKGAYYDPPTELFVISWNMWKEQ